MIAKVDPALAAGISAALVGVVSATVSYLFGRLTLRTQLENRLKELRQTAEQDREKAIREYTFQAMKSFRETVGGPKSQIIEAVQNQSSFLLTFLPRIFIGQRWDRLSSDQSYRRYVLWELLRPYVWIQILDRSMLDLDKTLAWVRDELRFVGYCRLLMRAATEKEIFGDADYHYPVWGHLWEGDINELMEQLIVTEGPASRCISQGEFMKGRGDPYVNNMAEHFLRLTQDEEDAFRDLRRARLVAIDSAANMFLEKFGLPYSRFEPWRSRVENVDRLVSDRQHEVSIKKDLTTFLSDGERLLES